MYRPATLDRTIAQMHKEKFNSPRDNNHYTPNHQVNE